ncbi:MAG: pilus assembly protein N-terminal domain-containing protein [Alphaproteobacteria bacterium]|nr:pilus assembly protein N-terminal domain-containing protein [Alphaproteobacteria bacterium]MBL6937522.1 pilus assembly protein N-terminal domain-containing protein [Alphaproteobacteria bacterium]MBL7098860.1 pilus assembly protein N-terminal domain-containing protein [Alphaproteobacteria bacterium]
MRLTIATAFVFGLSVSQAFAGTVSVPMDEVRTVTFPRPVATVYMGNSTIADVNLIDSRHAFVLGKVFGTTNLIALDSSGHEVSNVYVAVPETRGSTVTVFHGVQQVTMSCGGPRCNVSPVPGDAGYKDRIGDVEAHHELGAKQAQ